MLYFHTKFEHDLFSGFVEEDFLRVLRNSIWLPIDAMFKYHDNLHKIDSPGTGTSLCEI